MQRLWILRFAVGASYLCLAWLVYYVWRRHRCVEDVRQSALAIVRAMRIFLQARRADDPFEIQAEKMALQRRLDRAMNVRILTLFVLAPVIFFDSVRATCNNVWGPMEDDLVKIYFYDRSLPGLVTIFFFCILFTSFKRFSTPLALDIVFALQMLRVIGTILSRKDVFAFVVDNAWTLLGRFTLCMCNGNVYVTIPGNIIVGAVNCWSYNLAASSADMNVNKLLSPEHVDVFVHREIFFLIFSSVFCWINEHTCMAQVRAELSSKSSVQLATTFQGLLSVLCDVVVHLTDDLCIDRPCPQLGIFLLSGRSGECFLGSSFVDLMVGVDHIRFRDWIARGRHESHAQALNVKLKSAEGIVNARIYHVSYENISGRLEHIVGISEEGPASDKLEEQDGLADMCIGHHRRPNSSSNASASSKTSAHSLVFNACCDIYRNNLKILDCDLDFAMLYGCHPLKQGLFEVLVEPDAKAFLSWVQTRANALLAGEACSNSKPLSVTLCTPLMSRLGIHSDALCRCSFVKEVRDGEMTRLHAALSFVLVKHRHRLGSQRFSNAIAVVCSLENGRLLIRQATLGFSFLCGYHPQGENMLPWVARPVDFMELVRENSSAHLSRDSFSARLCKVTLQTPFSEHLNVNFTARCHISCTELDVDSVRLTFTQLKRSVLVKPTQEIIDVASNSLTHRRKSSILGEHRAAVRRGSPCQRS